MNLILEQGGEILLQTGGSVLVSILNGTADLKPGAYFVYSVLGIGLKQSSPRVSEG